MHKNWQKYGCIILIALCQSITNSSFLFAKINRTALQSLFEKQDYSGLNTAAKEFYLSEDEKLTIALINLARFFPKAFIKEIVVPSLADTSGEDAAILIARLHQHKGTFPLIPAFSLFKSAHFHSKDMGMNGNSGHKSSDGKNYVERITQYFSAPTEFHENYYQGGGDPVDVVLKMLMGKGELGMTYRENILSPNIHYIGISISPHKTQCTNAVIDFAKKPVISPSTYNKKRDKTEVYWRDCPTGTKINVKRKSGGFSFGGLFGSRNK